MQLAGHLCGKAAREYTFLSSAEKQSFDIAVQAIQACLDLRKLCFGSLRYQKFYIIQHEKESVSDSVTR